MKLSVHVTVVIEIPRTVSLNYVVAQSSNVRTIFLQNNEFVFAIFVVSLSFARCEKCLVFCNGVNKIEDEHI